MKLGEIKNALVVNQLRLTKSLGQNFLHDRNQILRLVTGAELNANDQVLEIGPGLGALTEFILAKGVNVLAIEKDRRLFELLDQRWGTHPKLTLIHADALDYLQESSKDWLKWKVVSNLPFSVASALMVELAGASGCPERLVVTLQMEAARRLMALPGDGDYGVLTLLMQLHYEPKGWFKIPASCFFPIPKVDSAGVILIRRPKPLLCARETKEFERLVKRGFSQRRKTMMKLLKTDWSERSLTNIYKHLELAHEIRAEKVSLEQFVRLTEMLCSKNNAIQ